MAETEEGQQDQSMEGILQSIKRIIAEEGDANAENQDDASAEVLELTDMVETEEPAPSLATASDPLMHCLRKKYQLNLLLQLRPNLRLSQWLRPHQSLKQHLKSPPAQMSEKLPEPAAKPEPVRALNPLPPSL